MLRRAAEEAWSVTERRLMFANAGPFSASLGLALLVAVQPSQGSSVP
jgi:hypothetical protein